MGESGFENFTALSSKFTNTCSMRDASMGMRGNSGSISMLISRVESKGASRVNAAPITSCKSSGCIRRLREPASKRLISNRLPTRRFNRADSSIPVSINSSRFFLSKWTVPFLAVSASINPLNAPVMEERGVLRS